MRLSRSWLTVVMVALVAVSAIAAPMTRQQALAAVAQPDAAARLAAIERLAEIGSMADADPVLDRLVDTDPRVRDAAAAAAWQIWSRSGDPAIDRLLLLGSEQMQASALREALATFDEIVRRKPAFAEGWNKRATVYFLLGEHERSLKDCEQVFKRNPRHFGALSGAGQIHLQLGNLRLALEFFRKAVKVNPDLAGPAQLIPLIEQRLLLPDRNTI